MERSDLKARPAAVPLVIACLLAAGAAIGCGGATTPLSTDAGCPPLADGGTDAGVDGGPDAGPDGGPDAGPDGGPDGGPSSLLSQAMVDEFLLPLIDAGWIRGAVIGAVDSSGTVFYSYGVAQDAVGQPPTADTEFEIGSITKTFTALLLAQNLDAGVHLADLLQGDVPALTIPTMEEQAITLEQLATHSSGLADVPSNWGFGDSPTNPNVNYTVAYLQSYLTNAQLLFTPGTQYSYSNLGYGLLGYALGQRFGSPYRTLLQSGVLDSLGLSDTAFDLTTDQTSRFADGHDADLNAVPHWTWENDLPLEAAGALRSTARDLAKLAADELDPSSTEIGPAISATQQVLFDDEQGNRLTLGLAQEFDGILWKGGATAGFTAFLGFDPSSGHAVVALSNVGFIYHDLLGVNLLRAWRGESLASVVPLTVNLTSTELNAFVGTYSYTAGFEVTITLSGGQLYAQGTGQASFGLYPDSASSLYARVAPLRFFFYPGTDGKLDTIVEVQNGQQFVFTRVH